MADLPYLHGFTENEQKRLIEQSVFLEPWVYDGLDFNNVTNLLEIGAGVGAQTAILLRRYPWLQITCIDHSEFQLHKAERYLSGFPEFQGRFTLKHMKGEQLDFNDATFDGVYFCWVLEHVSNPENVLKEALRVLKVKGEIFASEVFNASFFTNPDLPNIHKFWCIYNDFQVQAGGDPNVGVKLGNLFSNVGFDIISIQTRNFLADHSDTVKKEEIIQYWTTLLWSAGPNLVQAGLIAKNMKELIEEEFNSLIHNPDGIFYCSFIRAIGKKK
jgi:SAM-dependent methyltransferase